MAQIKPRILRFVPSVSPDVAKYMLYIEASVTPSTLGYDSDKIDLGLPAPEADGKVSIDLSTFDIPNIIDPRPVDDKYDVGVTAIDTSGNEGKMAILVGVTLDFTAPVAPTELEIV